MKTFNSYQSKWAILTPLKGIATKKDRKISGEIVLNGTRAPRIAILAIDQKTLDTKLDNLKGNLSKEYSVLIITDKQFGMMNDWNYEEVATEKQLNSQFILK